MPGRVSARPNRSSAATVNRKSSTTTLKSRGSASARTSAYAVEVPDEGPTTTLRTQICQIFADAQKTTATQRKLVVSLRKIQEACCYEPQNPKGKKQVEVFDEEAFNEEVGRCALRVLAVKKSEPVGDRVIRFLSIFLKRASEEDGAVNQLEHGETAEIEDSPTSRLSCHILSILLQVITAKDKSVRYRATQMVGNILNSVSFIDDELFHLVRLALMKRLRDKEPTVRVQAVLGLGPLASDNEDDEDEDSDDDVAGGILYKLLDIMQNDPSAEVRRGVLMNLPFLSTTLKYLLERARDVDPATRRAVYGKCLPALGDFRHMSMVEREKLIRWGLRDRDEIVRKAAASVFYERWIENCAETHDPVAAAEKKPGEVLKPNAEALHELLERIDVARSGWEEGIAHEAMREFWAGRADYVKMLEFDDDFWNDLDAESAFIARSFNDYCLNSRDDSLMAMLEEKMPEVKRVSFFVQKHLNQLVELERQAASADDPTELEEEYADKEFVVQQLLHIARTLDYTDEVGRRQMFSIMREALAFPELSEDCTSLVVEVLRTACGARESGEKEFCSVVLEAIAEVRDTLSPDDATEKGEDDEESFHSAQSDISELSNSHKSRPKKKMRAEEEDPETEAQRIQQEVLVYAKCLHIAECMLQNIHCDLESNSALKTMLNTLVVPACRDHQAMIREGGIKCLGLCALLSKDLASNNLELLLHCFAHGSENLQIITTQALTDIIITHPDLLAPVPAEPDETSASEATTTPNPLLKPITKTLIKAFNSPEPLLNQIACIAASKLLLMNILPPAPTADILKTFTLAYFNPETSSNPALMQILSYFLPVFCHSRQKNALLMGQIAIAVVQKLLLVREEMEEDTDEMVSWSVVAGHFAEWTDGRRVVVPGSEHQIGLDGKPVFVEGAEEPHILLAVNLLERALKDSSSKDERKPLLTLLSKLHVSPTRPREGEAVDEDLLRTLQALASEAVESKIGPDATTRNYISKLEIALTKRLGEVEHVTQIQDGDQTEVPDTTELPMRGKRVQSEQEKAPEEVHEVQEEDEDTMMADMQAEGTRFPLEEDEEEDIEGSSVTVGRSEAGRAVTESDIVDSLLESEV